MNKTIFGIAVILVIGELFGSVVSRPIAAFNTKQLIDISHLKDLLNIHELRLEQLEEKLKELKNEKND